jgi:hypothetical protein
VFNAPTGGGGVLLKREAALELVSRVGSYEAAGLSADLPAGLVYLIATGSPADGSDGLPVDERERPGMLASSQHLSNPPLVPIDRTRAVREWITSVRVAELEGPNPARAGAAGSNATPSRTR